VPGAKAHLDELTKILVAPVPIMLVLAWEMATDIRAASSRKKPTTRHPLMIHSPSFEE